MKQKELICSFSPLLLPLLLALSVPTPFTAAVASTVGVTRLWRRRAPLAQPTPDGQIKISLYFILKLFISIISNITGSRSPGGHSVCRTCGRTVQILSTPPPPPPLSTVCWAPLSGRWSPLWSPAGGSQRRQIINLFCNFYLNWKRSFTALGSVRQKHQRFPDTIYFDATKKLLLDLKKKKSLL